MIQYNNSGISEGDIITLCILSSLTFTEIHSAYSDNTGNAHFFLNRTLYGILLITRRTKRTKIIHNGQRYRLPATMMIEFINGTYYFEKITINRHRCTFLLSLP